jgi:hypothetical protein
VLEEPLDVYSEILARIRTDIADGGENSVAETDAMVL